MMGRILCAVFGHSWPWGSARDTQPLQVRECGRCGAREFFNASGYWVRILRDARKTDR